VTICKNKYIPLFL
jgi:hypothetical protein